MSTSNQLELFENEINSSTSLQKLEIEYIKDFFNKTESDILFDLLKKEIEWKQDFIEMYGKLHPLPRLTAWYGDKNKSYTYSGISMTSLPWTKELLKVRRKLEEFSKQKFNKKDQGNIINVIDQRVFNLTPFFFSYTLSLSLIHI